MNKFFLFLALFLCLLHEQSIAQNTGTVKWSVLADLSSRYDSIHSIKAQPDGKIVAAGNSFQGAFKVIALGRYADGIPDSSFGINGMVMTSLDSAHIVANAVELQQDGKIVVAGGYTKGTSNDFVLVRYGQDGSVDSSFGINGIVLTDIESAWFDVSTATALAIQPDGKIVAAGRSDGLLALCRYKVDGSPDSSFDSDGIFTFGVAGASSMTLQANGKIVVCCGGVVIRLHPDGSLDNSFGTNGIATLTNNCYGMAIQKDGKIVVSGGTSSQITSPLVLERLDSAGVHDSSFGQSGVVVSTNFSFGGFPGSRLICLQADGRIIVTGYVLSGTVKQYSDFGFARFESNGKSDPSFGFIGMVSPYINGFTTSMPLTAVINNGLLILAGTSNDDHVTPSKWAMASYYLGSMLAIHSVRGGDRQLIIAPNPAQDFTRVRSSHIDNGTWHLSLSDLTGRILFSEMVVVTNNVFDKNILLTGLPVGMYLVKLENGSSRMGVMLTKSR
jgi:uncharacterized delta-60 repeat protein